MRTTDAYSSVPETEQPTTEEMTTDVVSTTMLPSEAEQPTTQGVLGIIAEQNFTKFGKATIDIAVQNK